MTNILTIERPLTRLNRVCSLVSLKLKLLARPDHVYDPVFWVFGDGRSGTTWLMELLAQYLEARTIIEPFHPKYEVRSAGIMANTPIELASAKWPLWCDYMQDVFGGRIANYRQNLGNFRHLSQALVVKDVFSNLVAADLLCEFPFVNGVLIIRNPVDVAGSKRQRENWQWYMDSPNLEKIAHMPLFESYGERVQEISSLVRSSSSSFLRYCFGWCLLNIGALMRLKADSPDTVVVAYEALRERPVESLEEIIRLSGCEGRSPSPIETETPSIFSSKRGDSAAIRSQGVGDFLSPHESDVLEEMFDCFGVNRYYSLEGDCLITHPIKVSQLVTE